MQKRWMATLTISAVAFTGGIAIAKTTEYFDRQIGSLFNGGDRAPLFLSSDFTNNQMDNLAVGETVGVAEGADFAMARADTVDIALIEKIPVNRTGKNVQLNARAIDLDGDGKADLSPLSDDIANFEAFKQVRDAKNKFGKSLRVEVPAGTELRDAQTPTTFVLIFVNAGKKPFTGTATLIDRLDKRITVRGPIRVMGATDQRRGNAVMAMIPYLNLFTSGNADFKWEERLSAGIFASGRGDPKVEGDLLKVVIPGVTVKPRQGIAVEFDAVIDWGKL